MKRSVVSEENTDDKVSGQEKTDYTERGDSDPVSEWSKEEKDFFTGPPQEADFQLPELSGSALSSNFYTELNTAVS